MRHRGLCVLHSIWLSDEGNKTYLQLTLGSLCRTLKAVISPIDQHLYPLFSRTTSPMPPPSPGGTTQQTTVVSPQPHCLPHQPPPYPPSHPLSSPFNPPHPTRVGGSSLATIRATSPNRPLPVSGREAPPHPLEVLRRRLDAVSQPPLLRGDRDPHLSPLGLNRLNLL